MLPSVLSLNLLSFYVSSKHTIVRSWAECFDTSEDSLDIEVKKIVAISWQSVCNNRRCVRPSVYIQNIDLNILAKTGSKVRLMRNYCVKIILKG